MSIHYVARRLGQAVFVLWAVFTLSFFALFLLGDPVLSMIDRGGTSSADVNKAELAKLRHQYGFDQPVIVQYGRRLWSVLQGQFGTSFQSGEKVTHLIGDALPSSAELVGAALVLSLVVGLGITVAATYARSGVLQQSLLTLPPLLTSIPMFLSGVVLLEIFSFHWHLVPAFGSDGIRALILPAVTLAIPVGAVIAQVLLRSMRAALREPYVETVMAKGARPGRVYFFHALRNASLPALTVSGLIAGQLFVGAFVVETVFSRNGLGTVLITAVQYADIYVVQTIVLLVALVIVLLNLLVDLLYPLIDPRVTTLARL